MNYMLNIKSQNHPVEDIRLPSTTTLAHQPKGQPFSFVSSLRLPIGENCFLVGDAGGLQLEVHACFAFAYCGKFLISGVIVGKQNAPEFKTDDSFRALPNLQPA